MRIIFEVTQKKETKRGVNLILAPEDPREADMREVDHPNRKIWRDRYRKPEGSLSLVVSEDFAKDFDIGDTLCLCEEDI